MMRKKGQDLKTTCDKRKVVFIEGDKALISVGNDLFSNSSSIKSIIVPSKNAFH